MKLFQKLKAKLQILINRIYDNLVAEDPYYKEDEDISKKNDIGI